MPKKSKLLEKLLSKPAPTSFTIRELDALMKQCGCEKFEGGRGSRDRLLSHPNQTHSSV